MFRDQLTVVAIWSYTVFMTYKIVRKYADSSIPEEEIATGLTLEAAREHCRDPETSSSTCKNLILKRLAYENGPWFDAYEEE